MYVQGWPDVWRRIDERRGELRWSKRQLYAATGISERTFQKMAEGIGVARPENRARICDALGWSPDSIDRLLAGQEPELLEPAPVNNHVTRDEFTQLRDAVEVLRQAVESLTEAGEARVQVDVERPPVRQPPRRAKRRPS